MDESTLWGLVVLLVIDFVIAWVIRKSGLQRAFEAISTICFLLPLSYFLWDWQAGLQSGRYTANDAGNAIRIVLLYGLGAAFTGGIIGYFLGGNNSNSSS